MTLINFPGGFRAPVGPSTFLNASGNPGGITTTIDAANEAVIMSGHVITSDGASHTINTTGSSALHWLTGAVTFADIGTTVKVGLAATDTANGPPVRAVHVANVITFDVSATMVGGGGGITADAWQTDIPDAGTKTIANNDLVSFAIQATARAGADSILVSTTNAGASNSLQRPSVTSFLGGSYATIPSTPNALIVFSDGAFGWFYGSDVAASVTARTFNSASTPDEVGQLYDLPMPLRINGLYFWVDPDANFDAILYSDPLGATPVAERTVSVDANAVTVASVRRMELPFSTPYDYLGGPIALVIKPTTTSSITTHYKTQADAAHRITDVWGTDGYGVTRTNGTGAFANANSSLDHYYIGLLLGGSDDGAGGGGGLATPLFGGGVI